MKAVHPEPLRGLLDQLRTSLWFLPCAILAGAGLLALAMLRLDRALGPAHPVMDWAFDAGPEAARTVLATIAGSMVTVAGVVFSIAIVVLTLAASQYSPRVIRNFMRDRLSQVVLGVFAGVYVYCLLVLGAVDGDGDGGGWVPRLATSVGMASAVAAIVMLVLYIHHIARAIQAVHILAAAANETMQAITTLFPEGLGEEPPPGARPPVTDAAPATLVRARRSGYLQRVDVERLLRLAEHAGAVVQLHCQVGDFVAEGDVLAAVHGVEAAPPIRPLQRAFAIGRFQTVEQDPGYGLREIVDVALRALSPAMNDETSASEAIDYIGAVLARLAARPQPACQRYRHGACRVVVRAPTFEWLLGLGFGQIVRLGTASPDILQRVLHALQEVATRACDPGRRAAVAAMAERVARSAEAGIVDADDRRRTVARARELQRQAGTNPG